MADTTKVKKKVILNMDMASINFNEEDLIMKVNGGIIKCKERAKATLRKINFNTQDNGKPINIMVGVFYTPIHKITQNGSLIKASLKME